MRSFTARPFATALFLLVASALGSTAACAQAVFASASSGVSPALAATTATPVVAAEVPATVLVTGHIRTAAGPLPGAVIKILGTNEMAVTDADGSFHVTVPASNGPLKATASYAGFADEPVELSGNGDEVTLKTSRFVVVSKSQSLKTYRKTARKQAKRSIHSVRKANK